MKKIYKLISLLLISMGVFINPVFSQNDSIIIKQLIITSDTTVAGIQGVSLSFSMEYSYDTAFHKSSTAGYFSMQLEVLCNGEPVSAESSTNAYQLMNGKVGCDVFPNNRFVKTVFIHVPYYAMELSAGVHDISFRLSALISNTQLSGIPVFNATVIGNGLENIRVNIPVKEYFKVVVNKAVAFDSDFDGRGWDYVFSDRRPPDMVWKVVALGNDRNDFFYSSPKVKSSYSAEWTKYSQKICVSSGDVFYILVVDNDPSYDDLIAYMSFTLNELLELSAQNSVLQSGKLSAVKISAQRLN